MSVFASRSTVRERGGVGGGGVGGMWTGVEIEYKP